MKSRLVLAPLQLVITLLLATSGAQAQTSGVLREFYAGIGGNAVSDLTNSPAFPSNPTLVQVLPTFEAPTDVDENYGQRLSAYVLAPTTGSYTFWISSDDNSMLFLSTDDTPAHKRMIASVPGWTPPRTWTSYAQQTSSAIPLVGGQKYYIEALMKEGTGGDNLAVRWRLPNGTIEEPIPGNRLQVYGLSAPQITQQPANATATEGSSATFTVQLDRAFGVSYQWQRNGINLSGATTSAYTLNPVTMSDNAAQFRCAVTNSQGWAISAIATLTVVADTTPPRILSASNLGDATYLNVLFSESIDAKTGTNRANYAINNGVTVNAVWLGGDSRSAVLNTSPLNHGTIYTLTVNNVQDRAATPNTIAPNSQVSFTIDFAPLDISNLRPNRESPGPSSRRTGLTFSEIMYHPTNRPDGKVLEFIELYNSQVYAEDLSGYRLTGQVDYTFPTNTSIPAGAYLVIAPVPADIESVYGISGVLGGFTNRLSNGSGTVRLRSPFGAILLEANYSDDPRWPVSTDGAGHSLVLARPTYGEGNPEAWEASDLVGGTPGRAETPAVNPYRTVVINEFLAHTDLPDVDYIELYNYGSTAVDLTGCILTDDANTNRFVLPNVTIPALGFIVFTENTLGFALSSSGETIYFKNPSATKVIDAVRFKAQENGVATGRYPDGAPGFYRLLAKTPGSSNAKIRVSEVVINELMYNPVSGNSTDEYIELYNRGATPVDLSGWKLSEGVSFTFPANAVTAAGGYFVIAKDATRMLTNYHGLSTAITFGDYTGQLGNGDRVSLTMPHPVVTTNDNVLKTNFIHIVVDEVTYKTGGRWGQWANGGGSSLELIDSASDHRLAPNWADSDESQKSGWTNVEYTGVLDNGNGAADSLHIFLQGAGECLIDNVEVFTPGGANLMPNPGFESSFDGWFVQGTHDQSFWQNSGGYGGGKCLHIVASGRGDTGANRVRAPLSTTLSAGTTVTLRAKVRWLKGNPEVLLRLHGNWLEAYGTILTARNLGTPGAANSRAVAHAGPAIHDVSHSPVLPAAGQSVVIRAQVSDLDGLGSLMLTYRVDPATNLNAIPMSYNGAGLYSATIPGQAGGSLVAFSIQATDNASPAASSSFPANPQPSTLNPSPECLIRFGEPNPNTGRVGSYHVWITKATNDRWTAREKNSNESLDATFVYGNNRVVYNIGTLYSGSPWHTPGYNGPLNNICDYVLVFPDDDRMLGAGDFVLASLGNLNNDDTTQREQTAFWMLGQLGTPTMYRRPVNVFYNGIQRGLVYEDAQQPSADIVKEWFPDDQNGDLHKIEDWFEFDNTGDNKLFNVDATLQDFTTTGGLKKLARYRWNWRKRAVNFHAVSDGSRPSSANDYSSLFGLVNAVNSLRPEPFTSQVQQLVDYEEWTRIMAVEHLVGNWDSYGYNRGKNMYAYKPQNGKWTLVPWDIDFVLDNGGDGPTTDLNPSSMPVNDGTMTTFLSFAPIQRAWWRALQAAVNGPLLSTRISALMNAKYQGLTAAGIPVAAPTGPLSYVSSRRTYIQSLLAKVAANFTIANPNFSTNRNYIAINGTAPIAVKDIAINGFVYPVTWNTVSNWTAKVALTPGANTLSFVGYDGAGNAVSGSSGAVTVTYIGTTELAQDHVLINEIMYNPALPNAEFIEFYNTSASVAFDLSGYRVQGVDFLFPGGSIITPNGYLVIAGNAAGFAAAYGRSIPIAGVFTGNLQRNGETLKLIQPGVTPAQDVLIDQVTYDNAAPWPTAADGFGPSLQLIDPTQDNNRVGNWAVAGSNAPPAAPQWQYVTVTGTASSSRLYAYLSSAGDVYLDDLMLVAGAVPESGQNSIQNGDFESGVLTPWQTNANTAASTVSSAVFHSGSRSLHLVCNAAGTSQGDSLWQDLLPLTTGSQYTLSFWFLQKTNSSTLTLRLSGSGIQVAQNIQMPAGTSNQQPCTPGAANSVRATLQIPPLWLNEVQPNNVSTLRDNFGECDSWVELYNSGASSIDLARYYLSDTTTNLLKWPFPAGTTIDAGQFRIIWLDNQPSQTSGTNLHASFRATSTPGSVILTRAVGSTNTIIDYLNYGTVNNDRSFGAFPDATPSGRHNFYHPTPGAPNNDSWPTLPVIINEWMASNTRTLLDPASDKYSDWFELFNSGPASADLSGYYLANSVTNPTQFRIPAGYTLPSRGFLLVWADNDSGLNNTNDSALHVNFKLNASGETIALFAPDRTLLDSVVFGPQTNDVSQGRFPDGNFGEYYFMTNATPSSPNVLAISMNHPPSIAAIPSQTVYQGSTLTFTAQASDPDPGQAIVYTLEPDSPSTASINPVSGVFKWLPTQADPPALYTLTIRATDSGTPPLSVTAPVNISVVAPPSLRVSTAITLDGQLTLTWPAQPQRTYRVSFKSDLNQPAWATLIDLIADDTNLSLNQAVSNTAQGYYRIELLTP